MGNEKYLNHYVEILTGTMTDAVIRNVSLQANARVTEEVLRDQIKRNEDLTKQVDELTAQIKQNTNQHIADLENKVKGHLDRIADLEKQLNELNKMRNEYENVKNQASHLESFRSELIKVREENKILQQANDENINKVRNEYDNVIKELNKKIEYLQLTPAKRKKVDAENVLNLDKIKTDLNVVPKAKIFKVEPPTLVVKDGGSF